MEIISFRFQDFLSAFIILFAVIDITGLTPIIIDMKQKGTKYYRLESGQSIRWLHSSPFCLWGI